MRRIALLFVALTMAFSLAACSNNSAAPSSTASGPSTPTVSDNSSASGSSSSANTPTPESSIPESSQLESVPEATPEEPPQDEGGKVLVAYFSATNTTKGVAETIAATVGGELYQIIPTEPYTSADLNYGDDNSRSTKERNDPNARPAISGSVEDMSQYDVIFLGYPIWWGEAPRIIDTFVESYDFSDKTIVPFCTSGSSDIGSSAANLQSAAGEANWLSGRRLSSDTSQSEIAEWVDSLELNLQ